ncbi:MAG: chitobiase/beta-hexosaminidase C-terminal domain-containing protein [Desulfobulbaceae bacterium]|nr:chitobiase/beta-hexosaminidase C-terminal domain-containing protein [Desulfobulbaceae bacterium]
MKQSKLILFMTIFTVLTILVQFASGSEPCTFDLDNDGDVDGRDLYFFTQLTNPTPQDYADFAMQFGKTDCLIVPAPQITFEANPEIINGITSSTLSWTVIHATSIRIEPVPGDVTGSSSVNVTPALTTEYTLTATGKGGSSQSKTTVSVDTVPPSLVSFYPLNDSVIAANKEDIIMLGTFGDNLAGIKSVVLLDEAQADITAGATVTESTIEYQITPPQEKTYHFTLIIKDLVDNTLTRPITFRVDNTLPVTTPSMDGGRYSTMISLTLSASEDAVIYYSTNGYPPFVGAANTLSSPSPVSDIIINNTTRLQFFAVDNAGNRETTKAIDYMFNDIISPVTGLNAVFSQTPKQVNLSWNQKDDAQKYLIYRCMNIADRIVLSDSRANGYPPPKILKIGNTSGNTPNYIDTFNLVDSASYYYGVTYIDNNGVESVISDLAQVTVPAQNQTLTKEEAIVRAVAWLQNNQQQNRAWDTNKKQILATSQALNGLKAAGIENAGIFQALFFLKAGKADNNDYMARKILTLFNHGQNVDEIVNRLISKSYINNAQIYGWGVEHSFMVDALDTALGTKALACLSIVLKDANETPLTDLGKLALEVWQPLQGPENNKYGWVPEKDISPFVSAAVYSVTTPEASTTQWLKDLQQANGSFQDNITDTAGMLIWQTDIIQEKEDALQYLVDRQDINGSWENDPYLTGLCLEALLK